MARYCVAFDTMKNFHKITGSETIEELVRDYRPTFTGNVFNLKRCVITCLFW